MHSEPLLKVGCPLKVSKHEIFDGDFFASKEPVRIRPDIRLNSSLCACLMYAYCNYALAQHELIVTTRVSSAWAYCYYTLAQSKHIVNTLWLSISINFQQFLTITTRIVTRHILRQRITIENSNILANFRIKSKSLEILILWPLDLCKKPQLKISCLGTFKNCEWFLPPLMGQWGKESTMLV